MSLYNDLTTVLTPYANKIKQNESDIVDIQDALDESVSDLKSALNKITEYEASKNIFNDNWLGTAWTQNGNEYYGTLNAILNAYGSNTDGFPITFEDGTQYALSFKTYTETTRDDSATGLVFKILYSDGTQDDINVAFPTTADNWRSFSFISDAGKTIVKLIAVYSTGGATVWHLKEVQVEKGTSVTAYQEYGLIPVSAIDKVCRNGKVDKETGKGLSSNDFTDVLKNKLEASSSDVATVTSNGLMSASDKQKLDNILSPVSITITGSGIYKNASAYNFLPTNDALTNSNALQSIVTGGGTIIVDMPGVYNICRTCLLDSNTTLIFGANVYLNLVGYNNLDPVYPFINRGAFANTRNTNISIYGLYLIANNISLSHPDVNPIYGQRGYIAFRNVEHIIIKNCTIMDGSSSWYNVHVQQFNDVVIDTLEVHGRKDGIHLGVGSNYIIRNCIFETNDDAIAINAHDYPTGTSELGWIENGIIDNIHFVSAPLYNKSRGIYLLGGCWSDWTQGMTVREYGDAVVSNGRIYRTVGTADASKPTITSNDQPTHISGIQTYSDGVTWLMAQDENIGYTAGVKNLEINNVYIERNASSALSMYFDNDPYSRSVYPNAPLPIFENIYLDNLVTRTCNLALYCKVPVKNVRLSNIDWVFNNLGGMAYFENAEVGTIESSIGFSNCFYTFDSTNHRLVTAKDNRIVNIMVTGSLGNFNEVTPTCSGNSVIVSDDIGLTHE